MQPVVLASQSQRRRQLLEWAEVPFEVIVEHTDESYPEELAILEIPVFIARNKAAAVQHKVQDKIIIAADTVVVLNNEVIGKPQSREHAIDILQNLAGKKHLVITGVVIKNNKEEIAFADITEVTFYDLSTEQITFYVDKYKPYDKAGAYAIQEWIGVVGIKTINGDFYNVMGLPVSRVMQALESLNGD